MTDVGQEPHIERGAGEAIRELLAGFIQELREAGLPVSLTENLDAMEAVQHIPLEDREAFKYALAATLVKNNAHWRAFETVFEVYFSYRGPEYAIDPDSDLAQAIDELMEQLQGDQGDQGESQGGGGAMDAMTPEEIAQMLMKALQQGDKLLLCSDGLSGELPPRRIGRVLARIRDPHAAAHRLVELVLEGPARDNVSAIVLDLDAPVERPASAA